MGQYWLPVNLDKHEFINPHKLASGLKLWEQIANPMPGVALLILCAAERKMSGGGDFDLEGGTADYRVIAKRTIGRWAGDRIALVGDYSEDADLPSEPDFGTLYFRCGTVEERPATSPGPRFANVTDDVCAVIEHELRGKFTGKGWRTFEPEKQEPE